MSDEAWALEVRLFVEAIHARYGYDLRNYAPASLRRRVRAALSNSGRRNLGDLQHAVIHDATLFARVLADLTVRVSDMFRDPPFYKALRQHVVPVLRTYPHVRLWSAGCADGEEAFGLAVLLEEEGLGERCQIYATDLSPQALDAAKLGAYPRGRAAQYQRNYAASGGTRRLSDYYSEGQGGVAMAEALRRRIVFFQHDLVSDQVFGEMHVVLCRNVLIYFDRELRRRALEKLLASLTPGGFIGLGSSERLLRSDSPRAPAEVVPGTRLYRLDGEKP